MLEEKERANMRAHASLSLENGNLQRRLAALEERLARPTSLPAFSSAPVAHTQATTSTSASASSSTTPIVSVPFVAQETSTETVHVNTVPDVTTALQPLLMTQELRRLMPQPKFSGDRLKWKDFEAEWQLWWPLQHYPENCKVLVLIACLPPDVAEIYRSRVTNLKLNFDQVWAELKKTYQVDDVYSLRSRWYGCKCVGATLNAYLKWSTHWTMLRERIADVSATEEKTCFVKGLSPPLQKVALKKDREGVLSLTELQQEIKLWVERDEAREALQQNLDETSETRVVQENVGAVFSRQSRNNFNKNHKFVHQEQKSPVSNASRTKQTRFASNFRASSNDTRRCFHCGEQGHVKVNCPKLQKGKKEQRTWKLKKHCDFCGRDGHVEADCFSKQRQQKVSQSGKPSPSGQSFPADRQQRHRSA